MAVLGTVYSVVGTNGSFLFRDSTDYGPATNNVIVEGTPTAVQIDCTSLANTAFRQSNKADLGASRAVGFFVLAAVEMAATPTSGQYIEFFWAPSNSGTAAVGNPGGVSGADGAYTGYASGSASALAACLQLQYIGRLVVTADVTTLVQIGYVGYFRPPARYGSLVVRNASEAAFHSDMVETSFVFQPDIPQLQS